MIKKIIILILIFNLVLFSGCISPQVPPSSNSVGENLTVKQVCFIDNCSVFIQYNGSCIISSNGGCI